MFYLIVTWKSYSIGKSARCILPRRNPPHLQTVIRWKSVVCEFLHFGIGAYENYEPLFAPLARTLGKLTYDVHGNRLIFLFRAISAYNADTAEFLSVFHDTTSHIIFALRLSFHNNSHFPVRPRHCYYIPTDPKFLSTVTRFAPKRLYSLITRNSTCSTDSRTAFFRLYSK